MCDTLVYSDKNATYLMKNCDREPGEFQPVVRLPAVYGDHTETVATTYLEIPQVANRFGVLLCKPAWGWGGEMGVNDRGVSIGYEAVFTDLIDKKGKSLLGLDLVRLGLERGRDARQALEQIIQLLERYGQGGPSGFRNKHMRHDNSFLIADPQEAWLLESAGNLWVSKRVEKFAAISNRLSIGTHYENCSKGIVGEDGRKPSFADAHNTWFTPFFCGALSRQERSHQALASLAGAKPAFSDLASILRGHYRQSNSMAWHDNRDLCMHAASYARPVQTCGSMMVRLAHTGQHDFFFTGTSAPCLSLFKPVAFGDTDFGVLTDAGTPVAQSLWFQHESIHRRCLFDKDLARELRADRDQVESCIFALIEGASQREVAYADANRLAAAWQENWYRRASAKPLPAWGLGQYRHFWRKQNHMDGIV